MPASPPNPPPPRPQKSAPEPVVTPLGAAAPAMVTEDPPRRGFLTKALAILIGGFVALAPLAVGVAVFIDPLRKRKKRGATEASDGPEGFVKIAKLDALLVGIPQSFTVIDDRTDAWNLFPREPLGGVFLLRRKDGTVLALNSQCTHLGCDVDYQPARKVFQCPCHNSSFNQDGSIASPASPAARPLDRLETYIESNGQIWVKFQKFRSATPEKIPIE